MHILITEPIHPAATRRLATLCKLTLLYEQPDGHDLFDADAIIVRNKIMDRDYVSRFSNLKVIAKHGTGIDNIDAAYCNERGITLLSAPSMNASAVAEGVLAMLMAAARKVPYVHQTVSEGNYDVRWELQFPELAGKTLGVVGCGEIGRRVADMCRLGFAMRIVGYDPYQSDDDFAEHGIQRAASMDMLLRESDVVSLHLPLTPATQHLINHENIQQMKPGAILINASRGGIVDEHALCDALNEGRLYAAALDVFENEPDIDAHLRTARNLVLSPHTAGKTIDSEIRVSSYITQSVLDHLKTY